MKIIRIISLAWIPATLFLLSLANCKNKPEEPTLTLKDKIQGKSYILGTVTKNGVSVTSEFTGFKISFSADATVVTIISGGTSSATCNVSATVAENTITLATPDCFRTSTLTNVSTGVDGSFLKFDCTLQSSSIVITPGGRTSSTNNYTFNLIKQ
ncbi:MAG: hypothetical protein HYZ44_09500 [Bacteroidetes bacterium]|nr:hypothetical protein [Bacteroidota bacterium]